MSKSREGVVEEIYTGVEGGGEGAGSLVGSATARATGCVAGCGLRVRRGSTLVSRQIMSHDTGRQSEFGESNL